MGAKKNHKKNANISAIRSDRNLVPDANDGTYAVTLNSIRTVALDDSGADFSTISKGLFKEIVAKHSQTVQELLEGSMILEHAVKGGVQNGKSAASAKIFSWR